MCMCVYICIYIYVCIFYVLYMQQIIYSHTMEYYSTIKKNDIMSFVGKWIELEIITREQHKPSSKGHILHDFIHLWNLELK
jgi:hypothetical protein